MIVSIDSCMDNGLNETKRSADVSSIGFINAFISAHTSVSQQLHSHAYVLMVFLDPSVFNVT